MLEEYNRKRKFGSTPEPPGEPHPGVGHSWVVQKHQASRLHYDLRLEMDGVLRSWAVPKGPSLDPDDKRLAVQTEDHPVDYGGFEGVIPKGNYGAGRVIIWDRGTYEMVDPKTPQEAWRRQKFHVVLRGDKLRGEWVLVKTGRGPKEWLFFKVRDAFADSSDITVLRPESVVSGLKVEEIGAPGVATRRWDTKIERLLEEAGIKNNPRVPIPESVSPMLPTLTDRVVDGDDWLYEIKFDGVRAIASKQGSSVTLRSRNGNPLDGQFPHLIEAVRRLQVDSAVIDAEIVAFDSAGRSRFSLLQPQLHRRPASDTDRGDAPAWLCAFDLVHVNGFDLSDVPLVVRKSLLRTVIPEGGWIRYTDDVTGDGARFFQVAGEHGLEGIVAKKKTSRYHEGRSRQWLKIKTHTTGDFVVMGFTPGSGSRGLLGALVLGQYDNGRLRYVGRAGSGFDASALEAAYQRLMPLARKGPLVDPTPRELSNVQWVNPQCVAEVRFSEWTPEGRLRAPVFLRFREDIAAADCVFHRGRSDPAETLDDVRDHPRAGKPDPEPVVPGDGDRFVSTNVDKVFWPGDAITKGDLIAYYREIEIVLAPYLEDRPLVLKRYPDGISGDHFYQKDAPAATPDWIRTEAIWSADTGRWIHYFVGCDHDLLAYLANLGGITQNPWSSRVGGIDYPDYVIFDLDPVSGTPYRTVQKVALRLREILQELDLRAYPKTSGASGIHVYLPLLEDRFTYGEVRTFAEAIARILAERVPAMATVERVVRRRPKGSVYVDYLQNAKGQTVASVYSPRARAHGPVSTPLRWDELKRPIDPARHNMKTIFRRLRRVGDLFEPVLVDRQDIAPFLEALGGRH